MSGRPPTLDYRPTPDAADRPPFASTVAFRLIVGVVLFLLAVVVPLPEGIWHVGHRPQYMVAIERWGELCVGRDGVNWYLGRMPLIVVKLLVLSVPPWLIARRFAARDRSRTREPS